MSVRAVTQGRIPPASVRQSTASSASASTQAWARPAEWLSLPDLTGQQRFAGVFAIFPDSNLLALSAAGAYTVDWGDGTTTNHTGGSTAYKEYDYSTISSAGESTLGYRQVLVQVYPQSGNLTSLNLQLRHIRTNLNSAYTVPWLDMAMNGVLSDLTIGGNVLFPLLEQVRIYSTSDTLLASLFQNCTALRSVPLFNTANVTTMNGMFNNCYDLASVPLFNTANVTNMQSMFQNCYALTTAPLFNTANVTNMSNMFATCSSLTTVPLFNTASVTNMSSMFQTCYALTTVPLFDTASVTNMQSMFHTCYALTTVPLFNTANVTNMSNMFLNCYALTTVPLFNTQSVTNMSNMFFACSSLTTIPAFNTAAVTDFGSMFNGCASLVAAPALDLSAARVTMWFPTLSSFIQSAVTGAKETISYASCKLSAPALNAIYANLVDLASGDAAYANVQLLMRFGGGEGSTAFTDLASSRGITVTGNARIRTAQSKFGGSSGYFDGTGDYISTPSVTAFAFGTGDYTVEAWLYIVAYNGQTTRIFGTNSGSPNFLYGVDSTGALTAFDGTTFTFGSAGDVSLGQWHHIAFARSGTSLRAYLNGTQIGTTQTTSANMINNQQISFPATNAFSSGECYIDSLRVTKGTARYTGASFTLPTAEFPAYSTATKTVTVTGNWGNVSDDPTIATAKGWTVTG